MKSHGILLGILTLALACGACKKKEESLSLLVWEGYSDASFVHAFEETHHCKVVASYMGSSDELVAKLRGGSASNYDVISSSSEAVCLSKAGAEWVELLLAGKPGAKELAEKALAAIPE